MVTVVEMLGLPRNAGLSGAGLSADEMSRSALLVDPVGVVRAATPAAISVIGGDAPEGKHWTDALALAPARENANRWLRRSTPGASGSHFHALTERGQRLVLSIARVIARGTHVNGRVLIVARASNAVSFDVDTWYEVFTVAEGFGKLVDLDPRNGRPAAFAGRRCYQMLMGRDEPCTECPVLAARRGKSATTVRVVEGFPDKTFHMLRATPRTETTYRVQLRVLTPADVSAVHQAKLALVAAQALLSEREQTVLELLLTSASLDDIARQLKVTRRTIKFHQENIFNKLGAESRIHLFEMLAAA
jgi:DNA-binding CsgD family transcriptional regulator